MNTKQLDNKFLLSTGLLYDTRRSNSTTKLYEAFGAILSIKDYNDDILVDTCYREGCEYAVGAIISISAAARTLELNINYLGGLRLNQSIFFTGIDIAFGNEAFQLRWQSPYEVYGPRRITVTLPPAGSPKLFVIDSPAKSLLV